MRVKFLFAAALLFAIPVKAGSPDDPYTVSGLLRECVVKSYFCPGFVAGVMETMSIAGGYVRHAETAEERRLMNRIAACTPQHTTVEDAVLAFQVWAAMHTESWPDGAVVGVMSAIIEKWPCK
jgi:hypothetical protein